MPAPLAAIAIGQGVIGAANAIGNLIKGNSAANDRKKLLAQRKPFQTNQEIYDIKNATESMAQQGYDPATLEYLTNNIDRAGAGALGTAERLGADPNDLSAIFDQQLQSLFKVGAENKALNMENFSKYLGASEMLSKNLDAEWASREGIIKDKLAAANQSSQEAAAGVSNGINTVISAASSFATGKLYEDRTKAMAAGAGLPGRMDAGIIETIPAIPSPPTQTINTAGTNAGTLAQTVTPMNNIYGKRTQRIIGIRDDGSFIYGT